jgi:hypothetical protein
MKRNFSIYSLLLISWACVDRISFDVGIPSSFPIVIDGHISDEPGPYTIKISKTFDIESKQSIRTPISVRKLILSDDLGTSEQLVAIADGEYQTDPLGIRGTVGRTYTLEVELLDGRIFRSIPDPLLPAGNVDSVYHQFEERKNKDGASEYGFNVMFNSSSGNQDNYYFLWKFVGTFQVETNPELYSVRCGESRCPAPLPCSSYVVSGGGLQWVKPCECCTCWAKIFNPEPIVSDNQTVANGRFLNVNATYLPITQWTFLHKVHAEVQQFSLSPQAFTFWKAIQDQKRATGSLFAPQSGKIISNFVPVNGSQGSVEGLFYASSIRKKSIYITRNDVPNQSVIPTVELLFTDTCEKLFPGAKTVKPDYWID